MIAGTSTTSGTRFLRPNSGGDTYDRFKGANLAVVAGGTFSDSEKSEISDTVETSRKASNDLSRQLSKGGRFRNVKVRPEAEETIKTSRNEVFKGVTFGNRWRIGHYVVTSQRSKSTSYKVDAEIHSGPVVAKTTMSISQPEMPSVSSQSGWYFFS
jgi:hypothetical protein